jgi:hypothetical protein
VGVEVVEHQHHRAGRGVALGQQRANLVGPIDRGAARGGVDVAPAGQRRGEREVGKLKHGLEICAGGAADEPFLRFTDVGSDKCGGAREHLVLTAARAVVGERGPSARCRPRMTSRSLCGRSVVMDVRLVVDDLAEEGHSVNGHTVACMVPTRDLLAQQRGHRQQGDAVTMVRVIQRPPGPNRRQIALVTRCGGR